jgi:hypothetical protein
MNALWLTINELKDLKCYYNPDIERPKIKIPCKACINLKEKKFNKNKTIITTQDLCLNCEYKCVHRRTSK